MTIHYQKRKEVQENNMKSGKLCKFVNSNRDYSDKKITNTEAKLNSARKFKVKKSLIEEIKTE